jgi:glycosyltransferase involved in cell wall biosynthesis
MRLGIIARSDNTGLGNQTKELVDMLKPDKVMLINSQPFNKNKQYPERYDGYNCQYIRGFPKSPDMRLFLKNIDVILTCETFYGKEFIPMAKKFGVKTFLQYNYEFLDHLQNPNLDLPDVLLAPSLWGFKAVTEAFGDRARVIHLPPPTNPSLFNLAKSNNLKKDYKRLLHVGGKAAHLDRNGTNTIIEMLKYSKADYEIVIKSQSPLNINTTDSRLSIDISNPEDRQDLYSGFDAMVLPRRYAGLCLPMNEALLSGLPVFMTDISPNNSILPKEWLVPSQKIDEFKARTMIDVYEADAQLLAKLVDDYIENPNKIQEKNKAFDIGYNNFSVDILKDKYLDILK